MKILHDLDESQDEESIFEEGQEFTSEDVGAQNELLVKMKKSRTGNHARTE